MTVSFAWEAAPDFLDFGNETPEKHYRRGRGCFGHICEQNYHLSYSTKVDV